MDDMQLKQEWFIFARTLCVDDQDANQPNTFWAFAPLPLSWTAIASATGCTHRGVEAIKEVLETSFGSRLDPIPGLPHLIFRVIEKQTLSHCDLLRALVDCKNAQTEWPRLWKTAQELVDVARTAKSEVMTKKRTTVSVDVVAVRATLRMGKRVQIFELPSRQVARWLKVLCERSGKWIAASQLVEFDAELDGARGGDFTRSLKKKCPDLRKLIETSKNLGARFNPPPAETRQRASRRTTKR